MKLRYIPIDDGQLSATRPFRLGHAQIVPHDDRPRRIDDLRSLREKPAREIVCTFRENVTQFHRL